MPVTLYRVDDRLLHGQVSRGWSSLDLQLVVVADDAAAGDSWEREVYEASGPDQAEVWVRTLAEAAAAAKAGRFDGPRTLLLVRGPSEMLALVERDPSITTVNVGGLHAGPGRRRYEDDLQVSPAEAQAFGALAARGVVCTFQPLPSDPARPLPDFDNSEYETP